MPSSPLSPFIDQAYTSVYAYAGVAAIKPRLVEQKAIVVLDEDDSFLGVLTPVDAFLRSHYLVIDCLRDKPVIHTNQTIAEALDIMLMSQETVLPVFYHRGTLAGLLHQRTLVQHLLEENERLSGHNTSYPR